jgi:tetratricopeptide (TPR) repeat protein
MNARAPDPERWSDHQERDGSLEGALGATFRRVRGATLPSDEAVARAAHVRREPKRRASVARFAWRAAVAAALIVSTAGAVGAAAYYWRRHAPATPAVETAPRSTAPVKPHGRAVAGAAAQLPTPAEAPAVPPALSEAPPAPPSPAWPRTGTRHAPRVVAPAEESEVLGTAFRELRTRGDAAAAMRALDEYDRRFPAGVLSGEARIARAEAFMAQDRRREALPLLAALADDDGELTRAVRITRGELYAEAGRCAEAVRDFDRVLAGAADDLAGGRALYGRASCRLRAGETAGARTDLETYLALHAEGAFAAAARRALDSLP